MAIGIVPFSAFTLKADAAAPIPLSQKEYLTQAIQLIGAPYSSTTPGNPYSKSYSVNSASIVKSNGVDCTGFIWWTLASLGVKFTWNTQDHYPVPYDYNRWMSLYYNGGTMTYKGSTTNINIGHKDNQVATNWWDGVEPGSIIISQYGYYENGHPMNHGVYYIGEFANQAAIKSYLNDTLGLSVSDSAFHNRGNGTHWVIESNGSYGVKISNPPTISKSDIYTCNLTYFEVTAVKNDVYKYIVKKTDVSGNAMAGIKFGIYSDSSCTNKLTEITTNTNGIAWLDNSGAGYTEPQNRSNPGVLYAKEIATKTGYVINTTPVVMTQLLNTDTVPSTVSTVKNTDLGNLSIKKVTEDGKNLNGWGFTVKGMVGSTVVSTDTCTTNANGIATLNNLPRYSISGANGTASLITYVITETSAPSNVDWYYDASQSISVTLPAFNGSIQTKSVDYSNNLKRGTVKVTKTCEDGLNSGIAFKLTGTSTSGAKVELNATTDNSGVATFNNVLIGKNYTITEVDTAIKYVIPNANNVDVNWNDVSSTSFTNNLKKFTLTLVKNDSETATIPQGDATLQGAEFSLYKGGQLQKVYTTDKNGQIVTDEYVCGTDYTIKETKAPIGYLINNTVYSLTDADPANFTVEHNNIGLTVKENVIKGTIAIIKYYGADETNKTVEEGAEFELYLKSAGSYKNAKETERDYLITDDKGAAVTKNLPYGTYTLHQVKGKEGYKFLPDQDFMITTDGQMATSPTALINKEINAYIKVIKVDKETGKVIPVAGATFEFYDAGKNLITFKEYDSANYSYKDVTSFKTNNKGTLMLPSVLPYGTYYLKETKAPEGYVLDPSFQEFKVTEDSHSEEIGTVILENVIDVTKQDLAQKGIIKVFKQGEMLSTVTVEDDIYTPVYEIKGLQGAKYTITAAEDIITPDGTVRAAKGTVVATITTGNDGWAKSDELYLGKYTVTEVEAPTGYVLDTTKNTSDVTLVYAGDAVTITSTDTSFTNDRQKMIATLKKSLEKDEIYSVAGKLENVVFGLYSKNDIVALDGTKIPAGGLVERFNLALGSTESKCDLPFGTYYFKEIETSPEYVLDTTEYEITFEPQASSVKSVTLHAFDDAVIKNLLKRGTIVLNKTDEDGLALEGVVFSIYAADDTTFANPIMAATTGSDGIAKFENVPYGTWVIKETSTLEGYVLSTDTHTFTIENDKQEESEDVINEWLDIDIYKANAENTDEMLAEAEFTIFADTNENGTYDEGIDEEFAKFTEVEDETGHYTYRGLVHGTYFVVETDAPYGFNRDTNAYKIVIDKDTQDFVLFNDEETGLFLNKPIKGGVKVIKFDAEYPENKLSGAKFEVYKDVNENGEFDEDIDTYVDYLREIDKGVYELKEILFGNYFIHEAKAPEGFKQDDGYYFFGIIENDKIIDISNDLEFEGFSNQPIKGTIKITKTDVVDGKVLPNTGFRIYDEDGNVVVEGRTDENGVAEFELRYGKYYYQEFDAPEGYLIDENKYAFEITEDGQIIEAKMADERKPVQTDDASPVLYIALATMSTIALAGYGYVASKKKIYE